MRNFSIIALVNAAQARLAELNPDLKVTTTLELSPVEARCLADALNDTLLPAMLEAAIEARADGKQPTANAIAERGIALTGIFERLTKGMEETAKRLAEARDLEAAKREDEEIAELRRNLEPAE